MPDKAGRSRYDAVSAAGLYTALFAARYSLYGGKICVSIPAIRFDSVMDK